MPLSATGFNFYGKEYFPALYNVMEHVKRFRIIPSIAEVLKTPRRGPRKLFFAPLCWACLSILKAAPKGDWCCPDVSSPGQQMLLQRTACLWFWSLYYGLAALLVWTQVTLWKASSKQGETRPDTVIIRILETDISFQKLSLEYTSPILVISALTPYTQDLTTQKDLMEIQVPNFY